MQSSTGRPQLSVVLPCYNEAAGLETLMARYAKTGAGVSFELILVDNGSTDNTQQALASLLPRYPFARSVRVEKNQGYGHGIWTGLRAATADVLAWSHADLQTDPADVFQAWRLYQHSSAQQRILIKGRRYGRGRSERIISLGMQTLATLLLRTKLSEINAQPKLFHRELLANMTSPPRDLNFDLYALYTAKRIGWTLETIPVAFPPRQHGESRWAATWRSKSRHILAAIRYMFKLASAKEPAHSSTWLTEETDRPADQQRAA